MIKICSSLALIAAYARANSTLSTPDDHHFIFEVYTPQEDDPDWNINPVIVGVNEQFTLHVQQAAPWSMVYEGNLPVEQVVTSEDGSTSYFERIHMAEAKFQPQSADSFDSQMNGFRPSETYLDVDLQYFYPTWTEREIKWGLLNFNAFYLTQKIEIMVAPVVHDVQMHGDTFEASVSAAVGDVLRVTVPVNPTTGYTVTHSAEENDFGTDPISEIGSFYQRYLDKKSAYTAGVTGMGGTRVISIAINQPGVHVLRIGQHRAWETEDIEGFKGQFGERTVTINVSEEDHMVFATPQ